jgi:hypothetical protein
MDANPIGLVVLAVIALAAAFIYAWKHSETFRDVVMAVLNAVKVGALAVANFFAGPFVNFFKAVGAFFKGPLLTFLEAPFLAAKLVGTATWNALKAAWGAASGFFSGLGRSISGALSSAWSTVKSGFSATVNWLHSAVDKVAGFFTGLPGRIAGIGSIIGRDIMTGVKSLWNSTLGGKGITIPVINKKITIPKLAHGGVVDKPTLALIGEAGAEAVVPLEGANGRRAARGMGLPETANARGVSAKGAALYVENYNDYGGSARSTAEELLFLMTARGYQ